ncbi:putative cytochrome P450 E-class, group I [Triangularia setosa]|uniref:Cytochrome P450 E-class, group I n=1 Tax=Triangularia setosa TaxID=2587417 RepID=A0AAN6W600_9PEZI|nr:putative cytochrome P450 E-class, group I [Podospora setosa]
MSPSMVFWHLNNSVNLNHRLVLTMLSPSHLLLLLLPILLLYLLLRRILTNLFFHPLSSFPAPFYTRLSSLPLSLVSVLRREPDFLLYLSKKYPSARAIRISPNLLFFPHTSALKSIYWSQAHNHKGSLYGTGALGPTSLFSTISGDDHKALRKSLGGSQWSVSYLKNEQEPRIDNLVSSLVAQLSDLSPNDAVVSIDDKLAQFAADVMTLLTFGKPWGFIAHDRDEKRLLSAFREGLPFFGFAARCNSFRELFLSSGLMRSLILPTVDDKHGNGYLASQARLAIVQREKERETEHLLEEGGGYKVKDYLDYTLDARDSKGEPLVQWEKEGQITLLIQAGADTTGTALGATLRFMLQHPECLEKAREEINVAEEKGLLSTPVLYEETKQHLPYFVACIKEGLRLNPPAPNLLGRVILEKGGTMIDGVHVPQRAEVCSQSYTVGRDPETYGPDAEEFKPERWLGDDGKHKAEIEAASFVFGMGPRICLGKEIAIMELYKALPEIVRKFDFELVEVGKYVVLGGVAHNRGFKVRVRRRV